MNDPGFNRGISASPVTVEELGAYGPLFFRIVVVMLIVISLYCLLSLWKKNIKTKTKILWSFLLVIPLIGPLLYGYNIDEIGS